MIRLGSHGVLTGSPTPLDLLEAYERKVRGRRRVDVPRWLITGAFTLLVLGCWSDWAEAARNFVATQSPAPNAPVTMGTTGSLTYQIASQNTGGNTGERIYEVRFRMSGGLSTFSSTTVAPAGWTRTAYSTTSVTFRATSWANAIPTGSSLSFVIAFNFRSTTADTTEWLRDIRARYTTSTSGPPFSNVGSDTDSSQGGWTLRALVITLQITDPLTGTPISVLNAGGNFNLVMTVTNRSTATQSAIVSTAASNRPPATVLSGTVTASWQSTVNSPNPLTLAPGATGTVTYTYSTGSTNSGTINFTTSARNNSGSATSIPVTSPTLAVSRFYAEIQVSQDCIYNGMLFTVTLRLTNQYPFNITNVIPTLTPSVGAPITLSSGPSPSTGTVPANGGGVLDIQWTYIRTAATPGQTFSFTGSAIGNGQSPPPISTPTGYSPTLTAAGYTITVDDTNASSTNSEITWNVNNLGCSPITSVAVTIPAGWTWNGDSYSLVDIDATTSVETWTVGGVNPTFSAPSVADQLYVTGDGEYRLSFSSTPTTSGANTFTLTITHASGVVNTRQTGVTVNPYNFNSLNEAPSRTWREEFR